MVSRRQEVFVTEERRAKELEILRQHRERISTKEYDERRQDILSADDPAGMTADLQRLPKKG